MYDLCYTILYKLTYCYMLLLYVIYRSCEQGRLRKTSSRTLKGDFPKTQTLHHDNPSTNSGIGSFSIPHEMTDTGGVCDDGDSSFAFDRELFDLECMRNAS